MYSKRLLNKAITAALEASGSNMRQLALHLGISQSNLTRSLDEAAENNHLTLPKFAAAVKHLNLEADDVMSILKTTPKPKKKQPG